MGKRFIRRKRVNRSKKEQWYFDKAKQYRDSWRKRCKKIEGNLDEVPTREVIEKWLEQQTPFKCYITGDNLNARSMEADHITPINRKGSFTLTNIGLTSKRWNQIKGDMTYEELKELINLVSKWEDGGERLYRRLLAANNVYRRHR